MPLLNLGQFEKPSLVHNQTEFTEAEAVGFDPFTTLAFAVRKTSRQPQTSVACIHTHKDGRGGALSRTEPPGDDVR